MEETTPHRVRLDRWLWAARWFKTRALAGRALDGGKIRVNGERPKRARLIGLGDEVRIRKGPFEFRVLVTGLSEHRGPASTAQQLYQETPPSVAARAQLALALRHQPQISYEGKGRPTKRDRRAIERLKHAEDADTRETHI
jgi:ribosome-associated heat shock protein Hsp15